MSLTFTGGTDVITVTDAASIRSLGAWTAIFWINPVTLGGCNLLDKIGGSGRRRISEAGASSDQIQIIVNRATANTVYTTNNFTLTTGKWWFVAVTWDSAATPACHVYKGDLSTVAVECTYSGATDGSGAVTADSANLTVGNGAVAVFKGQMASFLHFNVALSLAQVVVQQYRPIVLSSCVIYQELGLSGTGTQPDWSGNSNTGAVTGATQSAHVPLPQDHLIENPMISNGFIGGSI